ncbi:MAG: hypothetical protein HETSPECPRED_010262 [Heterodermia speciosa]|uniref:Uncharacterized protein n=1 Tax=Heterodermia speciosa TaxID=116794 RepID=A0A8H3IAC2_9LECA|nr:MAG: hypothetical protein HETSPECPRED_010262 [Heterodermia speciosa]
MSGQKDAFPQGGSLSDMAATGTTVPDDSAKPRIIPSVASPDQVTDTASDPNDLGATDLASAATNASDMPRDVHDTAPVPETITGTGDSLPSEVGSKNLHYLGNPDLSKGDASYDKHVRQKGSDQERGAVSMDEDTGAQQVKDGVAQ